jgi:predicted RecA/RadA family phage recombinase
MALLASAGKWRYLYNDFMGPVTALNNSGGNLTAGTAVYFTAGAMAAAGDNNTVGIHGVLTDDVSNGAKVSMQASGIFSVGVSGSLNFAIDDPVYTAATGLVDAGSAGDKEVGRIGPYEDPANGASTVQVFIRSLLLIRDLFTHA